MKFTALAAALALALSGTLIAGCDRQGGSASGGSSATGSSSGASGTSRSSEPASTQPGGAPKKPSSPAGSGSTSTGK